MSKIKFGAFAPQGWRLELRDVPDPIEKCEQMTLRLVARYGDACNVVGPPEVLRRKLEILKGHEQDAIVRDIARRQNRGEDLVRAAVLLATPEEAAERLRELVDLGFRYLIHAPLHGGAEGVLTRFAEEVVPLATGAVLEGARG